MKYKINSPEGFFKQLKKIKSTDLSSHPLKSEFIGDVDNTL